MKFTLHKAILLLNYMDERGIDFCKFPDGTLVTRMDCEDFMDGV